MGENRGRKPKTVGEKPLDSVESKAALRALATAKINNGWSYDETTQKVIDYGHTSRAKKRAEINGFQPSFEFSASTINLAIKNNKPPGDAISKAIWLWVVEHEHTQYLEFHREESFSGREALVSSLKAVLGYGSDFDFGKLSPYEGVYRLYRPHHLDPQKSILASKLTIGDGDSLFDCSLESRYQDEFGHARQDYAEGKIVPHGRRMLAVVTSPGRSRANFILYFDDVDHMQEETGGVRKMGGIMLAAAGTGPASAWPIYARRLIQLEPFEPGVISGDDLAGVPQVVKNRLNRGAVYWQPKHQAGFFGRGH